jgi:hypothetical protein
LWRQGGWAVEVRDSDTKERYLADLAAHTGQSPPGPFHPFRVDVTELASIRSAEPTTSSSGPGGR